MITWLLFFSIRVKVNKREHFLENRWGWWSIQQFWSNLMKYTSIKFNFECINIFCWYLLVLLKFLSSKILLLDLKEEITKWYLTKSISWVFLLLPLLDIKSTVNDFKELVTKIKFLNQIVGKLNLEWFINKNM